MALVQWNPFREMDDLLSRFQRGGVPTRTRSELESWAPVVDIVESEKEYTVKAELPGVNKDDVRISLENGILTLSGERKSEHEEKDKKTHRIERSYGSYARSFVLPDDVQEEKITAESKDGVLSIHLPRSGTKKTAVQLIKVN